MIKKLVTLGCDISKISKDGFSVMSLLALGECEQKTLDFIMELGFKPSNEHLQDLYYQCTSLKNDWIFDFLINHFPNIENLSSQENPKQEKFTVLQASIINGLSEVHIKKLLRIESIAKSVNTLNAVNYGALHLACLCLPNVENKEGYLSVIGN